jgi:integrase/recombinase XerD
MRYPFTTAASIFMDAYSGVYSDGMAAELRRRYPKIGKQLIYLEKTKKIKTTNPSKLSADDIKEYVKYQRQRGLKPSSISHDVSAINMLCIFTADNTCVNAARIKYPLLFPPRSQKRLPITERPEFDRILKFASVLNEDSDLYHIRCYAETLLAFGAGLRTQEVQYAKVAFLDSEVETIFLDHVKGQGSYGQCRTVPIRPECRDIIRLWLKVRPKTAYLFTNKDGKPLATNSLTKDRNLVVNDTGIVFDYRKCRRTYAQYLIDEGLPVDMLSVILGHSSSKTTEKSYARPRDDRVVAEIIEKWSEQK